MTDQEIGTRVKEMLRRYPQWSPSDFAHAARRERDAEEKTILAGCAHAAEARIHQDVLARNEDDR